MIPDHNLSGVLPPFMPGLLPSDEGAMSPYKSTLLEFIEKFATTIERTSILKGFIAYRLLLKSRGILNGFQWLDGSFVEQVEQSQNRAPNDIDVVTFFYRAQLNQQELNEFANANRDILDAKTMKTNYQSDAYLVDLLAHPASLVQQVQYWFGLFSHQRETYTWKGLVEIQLDDDDQSALNFLNDKLAQYAKQTTA